MDNLMAGNKEELVADLAQIVLETTPEECKETMEALLQAVMTIPEKDFYDIFYPIVQLAMARDFRIFDKVRETVRIADRMALGRTGAAPG